MGPFLVTNWSEQLNRYLYCIEPFLVQTQTAVDRDGTHFVRTW
jgi:hypothetical protein